MHRKVSLCLFTSCGSFMLFNLGKQMFWCSAQGEGASEVPVCCMLGGATVC